MFQNVRQSMAWMHTWFGLVLGFVLMVSFFFGTLSVFDREIDRWAIPETRFAPQPMPSFDRVLRPIFERMQPDAEALAEARTLNRSPLPERFAPSGWGFYATHRDPVLDLWAVRSAGSEGSDGGSCPCGSDYRSAKRCIDTG